jgi:cardiolipin synthase
MHGPELLQIGFFVWLLDFAIRIAALFYVPRNRKPSSAMAWLLAIFLIPFIGILLFLIIGNTRLPKKRRLKQQEIDQLYSEIINTNHDIRKYIVNPNDLGTYSDIAKLNLNLGTLPVMSGNKAELISDYNQSIEAIAKDIDGAKHYVHIEYFIISADSKTEVFMQSIENAVKRGVIVRVMVDHFGPIGLPTFKATLNRLEQIGAETKLMLPVQPLKGKYQRPDLRNHRKIVVIDGYIAYGGSQNIVDRSYLKKGNLKRGLKWQELVVRVEGPVSTLAYNAVFICDWYSETDVILNRKDNPELDCPIKKFGNQNCQLLPSGPGFDTDNNLKLFSSLMYAAKKKIIITSPYFVPDEVMISAVTSAAERGVDVVLFVSEIGDQFMVFNAQRSFYEQLLKSGVKIYAYKSPYILHAKHFSIDDDVAVIGSSNMDTRSFLLNLETSLVFYDKKMVSDMRMVEKEYYKNSIEITLKVWQNRPLKSLMAESITRLTSALQ